MRRTVHLAFCLFYDILPKLKIFARIPTYYKNLHYPEERATVGGKRVSVAAPQEHRIFNRHSGLL